MKPINKPVRLLFTPTLVLAGLLSIALAAKPKPSPSPSPPPTSTGSSFATAYNVPYSYSIAESIRQASSGGFAVGAVCDEAAATTTNCNGPAPVLRVASSINILSQTQYR